MKCSNCGSENTAFIRELSKDGVMYKRYYCLDCVDCTDVRES